MPQRKASAPLHITTPGGTRSRKFQEAYPQALAQADAVVRNPDRLSANAQNYWFGRKDHLVKRAWECKA